MNRTVGRPAPASPSRPSRLPGRAVIACLVALGACLGGPDGGAGVDSRQFQDVVVPDGFRLRDRAHESWSEEVAEWRLGHFIYLGNATVGDASAYVRENMPRHSWVAVSDEEQPENGLRLRFERGIYSACYQFTRNEGVTQMVVDYTTDNSKR